MEWLKPKVYGAIPSARRAHSAVLWKDQIGEFAWFATLSIELSSIAVICFGGNGTRALDGAFELTPLASADGRFSVLHRHTRP